MKKSKNFLIWVTLALVLSTLACRLPFIGRADDTAADQQNKVTEPADDEAASPEPDDTEAADVMTEEAVAETGVYSDNGVQMTLPGSYEMGDVENDLAILVEGLQTMSDENSNDLQELYDNNKEDVLFWAYDTNSPGSHMTSVLVLKNEEFAGMSLTLIAAASNMLLGGEVDSMNQSRMTLGDKDVLRFQTTSENAGVSTAQAIYIFNEGGKLWLVGFFTNLDQLEERLPSFDTAVESFSYLPEE